MKILLTKRLLKSYEKLGNKVKSRIKESLREIYKNPYKGKKLTGELEDDYSWRIGDYRVIYTIDRNKIWIETVGHRREI